MLSDTYVLTDPQALNALGPVQTYLAAMPVYSKLTHCSGTPFYPNPLGPVCVNNSARQKLCKCCSKFTYEIYTK